MNDDTDVERSSIAADTAPSIADTDYTTYLGQINKFGLGLGQAMVTSNKLTESNVIYSPLSATLALSMTYAGARAKTADEMKTALGDTLPAGSFHVASNRLSRELASRVTSRPDSGGNTHKVELNIADALFVESSLELQSGFLDVLGREYDSGVHRADFIHAFEPARSSINRWVSDQTKAKITDLLPSGSITEQTRVVLVNAVYFYGSWVTPFKPSATSDASFQPLSGAAVQVPTMHGEMRVAYRSAGDFEVAELPYEGNQLRMTIVLPTAGKFEAVRSQQSAQWLDQAVTGITATSLRVQLPKFTLTVGPFSLHEGLETLGMKSAFTDQADFTGITTDAPISLSDVLQKAFIAVDENGTEAAAATGAIAGTTAVMQTTPFVVDRPFLFFIRDANGAVLFSGQVVNPTL